MYLHLQTPYIVSYLRFTILLKMLVEVKCALFYYSRNLLYIVKLRDIAKQKRMFTKNNLFTWMDVSSASLYGRLILLVLLSSYIGNILSPSFIHARHLLLLMQLIFEPIIWRGMMILIFFESLENLNDRSDDDYLGTLLRDIRNNVTKSEKSECVRKSTR